MDYFYCPSDHIVEGRVNIGGEEFAHLVHVMRKKEGDEIVVVDGRGNAYDVRLESTKHDIAVGTITASYHNYHEPDIDVRIAVGVLKNPSKFDFLVEKVTELGVKEIVPLLTERTISHHAKVDRWQKLALAAMKQSGRSFLPVVSELTPLNEFLRTSLPADLRVVAHEQWLEQSVSNLEISSSIRSIDILIGPEGGFSEEEIAGCISAGYRPFYLGERRLRTETSAIVAAGLALLRPKPHS